MPDNPVSSLEALFRELTELMCRGCWNFHISGPHNCWYRGKIVDWCGVEIAHGTAEHRIEELVQLLIKLAKQQLAEDESVRAMCKGLPS